MKLNSLVKTNLSKMRVGRPLTPLQEKERLPEEELKVKNLDLE